MNKVMLIGRLTKNPELKATPSGKSVATFFIAIDRMPDANGNKETDFIPVVVWGKTAENAAKYLSKGRLVAVNGRMQVRTYENQEKRKITVTEVIADEVEFLDSAKKVQEVEQLPDPVQFTEPVTAFVADSFNPFMDPAPVYNN